jgi:hypothetical protein
MFLSLRFYPSKHEQDGSMHELALVYFQTDRSKEPKGWIFLKDVSEIVEDGDSFKIVSYAR